MTDLENLYRTALHFLAKFGCLEAKRSECLIYQERLTQEKTGECINCWNKGLLVKVAEYKINTTADKAEEKPHLKLVK